MAAILVSASPLRRRGSPPPPSPLPALHAAAAGYYYHERPTSQDPPYHVNNDDDDENEEEEEEEESTQHLIKRLLKQDSAQAYLSAGPWGWLPIMYAADGGDTASVQVLLQHAGRGVARQVEAVDSMGDTCLHIAASRYVCFVFKGGGSWCVIMMSPFM